MEMEYCRGNPEYFVETYVKIESKDTEELVQPFKLWPKQREALRSIHEQKLNIVLKARQLGITWLALAYAAYLGLLWEGRLVIFLSKTEDGAKELVSRLSFIFAHMPLVQKEGSAPYGWNGPMWDASALELKVKFPDGMVSKFQAFPSSPSAARGRTADLLVLDEWAFQQFAEDIWKSVFPTINRTSGGKVIGVSTIERGTLFEKLYTEEDNGFNKIPYLAAQKGLTDTEKGVLLQAAEGDRGKTAQVAEKYGEKAAGQWADFYTSMVTEAQEKGRKVSGDAQRRAAKKWMKNAGIADEWQDFWWELLSGKSK